MFRQASTSRQCTVPRCMAPFPGVCPALREGFTRRVAWDVYTSSRIRPPITLLAASSPVRRDVPRALATRRS